MNTDPQTDIVNVDFWAGRIAAFIKLAEHYGMTVEIAGGELVVSRQVSDVFVAQTEVQWRAAPPTAAPVAAPPTGQAVAEPVNPCTRGATFCGQHGYDCPPLAGQAGLRDRIAKAVDEGFRLHAELEDGSLGGSITDSVLTAVLAALLATDESHRLALSTALGLGTSAPWDAIRERAAGLQAEVVSLTEASRRLLEQRQEMAEERYAWQERGDRAEERVRALEAGQAALSDTDRKFLAFALDLAADQMASRGDEFGPDDEDAMEWLRRLAAETPGPETQGEARPPRHTWEVESPRRDNWASWGTTYDERDWATERYEEAVHHYPARPYRLVRATTTYTVEAEHQPDTETPDAPKAEPHPTEADLRHALAVAAKFHGQAATAPAVVAEPGKENGCG